MSAPIPLSVRKTAFVALLAMLMHALLPLAMALPRANGVMMTLCSAQGSRQIFVAFGEQPAAPADGERAASAMCPLCVAGAQLALPPPGHAAPALPAGFHEAPALRRPGIITARPEHDPAQPRAPPRFSA